MGFHYARDHDLAGFGGEVCELAHRVHRETALLAPTPIADLEKTLNISPTQRLFRQVSACHQDFEIPAQALHEQVFFVLEFRIQARFAHTCGLFKVLNTRLSEAMLPEDGDRFVEDIFSGEQFSSSHCNIIGQFTLYLQYRTTWSTISENELVLGGPMPTSRKHQVVDLLKSLETKNPVPFAYVNPNKYIQHNLQVGPGPEGVATLIQNMPPDASVNTIRVFEDGDYVFAHTDYNFFGPKVGFDIFRFEDGLIVEHWDNLQETAIEPSPSGHTMIDGPTAVSDLDQTQANKGFMQRYMDDLLAGRRETFPSYFNGIAYIQHNPWVADTIPGLIAGLQALAAKGQAVVYKRVHMVLGEGNFVLVVAEATFGGVSTAIYDLFRIESGKIAEHWDTLQAIPPRDQWKNSNGKF